MRRKDKKYCNWSAQINFVKSGFFDYWLKSKKKLGGQHKIPRLSNQRNYIEEMKKHITRFL